MRRRYETLQCVWTVITADKYGFYNYRDILLPLLFEGCTGYDAVDDCCYFSGVSQSAKFKVEYKSMHSTSHLRKELTRDWGVWLTCWSMHFFSENIIVVARFKSTQKNWQFTIWHLLLKEEGCSRITRWCCTSYDTSHRLPLPKVLDMCAWCGDLQCQLVGLLKASLCCIHI